MILNILLIQVHIKHQFDNHECRTRRCIHQILQFNTYKYTLCLHIKDCFYMRAKVRNVNDHSNDGILGRVYANLHSDAWFELCNSNDGPVRPDHHLNCPQNTQFKIPAFVWYQIAQFKWYHSNCALLLSCKNSLGPTGRLADFWVFFSCYQSFKSFCLFVGFTSIFILNLLQEKNRNYSQRMYA